MEYDLYTLLMPALAISIAQFQTNLNTNKYIASLSR